jgi:hypothetical protein
MTSLLQALDAVHRNRKRDQCAHRDQASTRSLGALSVRINDVRPLVGRQAVDFGAERHDCGAVPRDPRGISPSQVSASHSVARALKMPEAGAAGGGK